MRKLNPSLGNEKMFVRRTNVNRSGDNSLAVFRFLHELARLFRKQRSHMALMPGVKVLDNHDGWELSIEPIHYLN